MEQDSFNHNYNRLALLSSFIINVEIQSRKISWLNLPRAPLSK